jgi:hypothetical protein
LHGYEAQIGTQWDISVQLALKELSNQNRAPVFVFDFDDVTYERNPEPSGQLGSEVAHLIGVRKNDYRGLFCSYQLLERGCKTIRRVLGQQRVVEHPQRPDRETRGFGRQLREICTYGDGGQFCLRGKGKRGCRSNGFKGGPIPTAAPLL